MQCISESVPYSPTLLFRQAVKDPRVVRPTKPPWDYSYEPRPPLSHPHSVPPPKATEADLLSGAERVSCNRSWLRPLRTEGVPGGGAFRMRPGQKSGIPGMYRTEIQPDRQNQR